MPEANITPPPTTRPSQPSGGSGGGAAAYIQSHKGVVIGGALAVAVGVFFLFRKKSSSSSTTAATTPSSTAQQVYPYSTGVTGDTNQGDYYAGILNAIQQEGTTLSTAITGLNTASSSGTNASTGASNPATGATNNGSASGSYEALTSPADLQALTSSNTPLFYQPTGTSTYEQVGQQPGNTTNPELAWIQQNLPGGTGLYVQG